MGKLLKFPSLKIEKEEPQELKNVLSQIVHFEGPDLKQNKRAALLFHDLLGNWAFIQFSDISSQIKSTYDISKMGSASIFFEEISVLTPKEQKLVLDYLQEEHGSDEPVFLTTSQYSLKTLSNTAIASALLDELNVNTVDLERAPIEEEALKELLSLFFIVNKD